MSKKYSSEQIAEMQKNYLDIQVKMKKLIGDFEQGKMTTSNFRRRKSTYEEELGWLQKEIGVADFESDEPSPQEKLDALPDNLLEIIRDVKVDEIELNFAGKAKNLKDLEKKGFDLEYARIALLKYHKVLMIALEKIELYKQINNNDPFLPAVGSAYNVTFSPDIEVKKSRSRVKKHL